jgi:hypothetical protein
MEQTQLNFHIRSIEKGKKVIENTKLLKEEIGILRRHAEFTKNLEYSTKKFLHHEANLIELQLDFALEKFIRNSFLD